SRAEPGSMAYSAVTQPFPLSRSQGGTLGSMLAVHRTLVSPKDTRTEPAAVRVKWRSKVTGRISSVRRPSVRIVAPEVGCRCEGEMARTKTEAAGATTVAAGPLPEISLRS